MYVGLFATAVFGSMVGNVVVHLGRLSESACVSAGCRAGRSLLPWALAVGTVLLVLAVARLFGPVFATPATTSWLLPSPVPRPALLRPRLLATAAAGAIACGLVAAAAFTLAGLTAGPVGLLAGLTALVGAAVIGLAARAQASGPTGTRAATWTARLLALGLWVALALQAAGLLRPLPRLERVGAWWLTLVAGLVLTALVLQRASAALGAIRLRDLAAGGRLAPGLSGALATLDLALVYDVVLAHRWRRRGQVLPRRGGPSGVAALVWTDLVRLRRRPGPLVVLAATVVLPFSVAVAGGGRATVVLAVLAGFVAGLPLLAALRVVARTRSLVRALPFPPATTRSATAAVPLVAMTAFGLATTPALHRAIAVPWSTAAFVGLAVGVAALASAVRWVTGRPPDYSKPLVSTPAGAVPTNLYASGVRGIDVALLASTPLLLSPSGDGAFWSLLLSGAVLAYLLQRD